MEPSTEFLIIWFFSSFISGCITIIIAKSRGHGNPAGWFFFGFFLFIVAILVALLTPPKISRNDPRRKCPYCDANVGSTDRNCPACKRTLPDFGTATVNSWEKTVAGGDEVEKWAKQNPQK